MSLSDNEKEGINGTVPVNDAERWIAGVCAIWSEYCGGSCGYLGGYEKNKANAKMLAKVLKEDWAVSNHDSGVSTLEYLLENAGSGDEDDEDYDEDFDDDDEDFDDDDDEDDEDFDDEDDEDYDEDFDEDDEDFDDNDEDDDEDFDDDEDYYEADTTAFDYACACNMCWRMFIAGYFTKEEALHYAGMAARKIQERYESWAEYFQDYIAGAVEGSNVNEAAPFVEALQKVLMSPYNPMKLDWNKKL